MESLGKLLHDTRIEKDITVDKAARQTKISKQYINALEAEDFEVFPGEAYLIGFMRVYAEYLELDPEEIIALYKNLVIQEQPVPVDDLVGKSNTALFKKIGFAAAGLVLAAGVAGAAVAFSGNDAEEEGVLVPVNQPAAGDVIQYNGGLLKKSMMVNDVIALSVGEKDFEIVLSVFSSEGAEFALGDVSYAVAAGQTKDIDIDSDGKSDIALSVFDLDTEKGSLIFQIDSSKVKSSEVIIEEPAKKVVVPISAALEGNYFLDRHNIKDYKIGSFQINDSAKISVKAIGTVFIEVIKDDKVISSKRYSSGDSFSVDIDMQTLVSFSNGGLVSVSAGDEKFIPGVKGAVSAYLFSKEFNEQTKTYEIKATPQL
jgi:transcriptional regulator with XRE-family HTH domain